MRKRLAYSNMTPEQLCVQLMASLEEAHQHIDEWEADYNKEKKEKEASQAEYQKLYADVDEFIRSTNKEKREKEEAQSEYQKLHGHFMDLEAKAVALETAKGKLDMDLTKMSNLKDHYESKYKEAVDVVSGMQETLTYLKRRWAVAEDDIKSYQDTINEQHNEKRVLTEAVRQLSREALSSNNPVRFPSGIEDVREILADVPDTWVGEQNG